MINECKGSVFTLMLATPIVKEPGGTSDYDQLKNKPTINGVELVGDIQLEDLGIQPAGDYPSEPISDEELEEMLV